MCDTTAPGTEEQENFTLVDTKSFLKAVSDWSTENSCAGSFCETHKFREIHENLMHANISCSTVVDFAASTGKGSPNILNENILKNSI